MINNNIAFLLFVPLPFLYLRLLFPFFFFLSYISYDVSRRQTYQNPGASFITSSSNLHSDFSCLHSGCQSSSPEHNSELGFESKSRVRVSESTQQIHDLGYIRNCNASKSSITPVTTNNNNYKKKDLKKMVDSPTQADTEIIKVRSTGASYD